MHYSVNYKHGVQTILSCSRSFFVTIKESVKAIAQWSAYYFTTNDRWYPLPEFFIHLHDLKFPKRKPSTVLMSDENQREMREWASLNGAVVCQRSGRQEITMDKADTLPDSAYFEELRPIETEEKDSDDDGNRRKKIRPTIFSDPLP